MKDKNLINLHLNLLYFMVGVKMNLDNQVYYLVNFKIYLLKFHYLNQIVKYIYINIIFLIVNDEIIKLEPGWKNTIILTKFGRVFVTET